jgi:hypothetical protein
MQEVAQLSQFDDELYKVLLVEIAQFSLLLQLHNFSNRNIITCQLLVEIL